MFTAEELQQSPTIDLEMLLQPISEDAPSGENVRYSGIYDEISEARRADDSFSLGKWQHELKTADFSRVIELADYTLKTQTKDLQIAAWFAEALTRLRGFVGLRDSLRLLSGLQEIFWETMFPEIDDGDQEGRANALAWIETQMALAIKEQPITGGAGLNYFNWEESRNFDIPDNIDTLDFHDQERYKALRAQAETEKRITGDMWRKARAATSRAFCEEAYFALEECWTEYQNLNRVIEEKFDPKQSPGLTNLRQSLDDVKSQIKRLLDEKRVEEPDPEEAVEETGAANETTGAAANGTEVGKGALQNRRDALKRLSEVAEYFRRNEPHSPVSYLIARAVKWGNMPLESWLQDVIKDENTIYSLRQTLGFNTNSGEENTEEINS